MQHIRGDAIARVTDGKLLLLLLLLLLLIMCGDKSMRLP
jgi:hypothetical protein